LPAALESVEAWTQLASAPKAERDKLFWEVVHSLQRKKKAERRQLEEKIAGAGAEGKRASAGGGDPKRFRAK
jgi:hypothetical protein